MSACPRCGASNPDRSRACGQCGLSLGPPPAGGPSPQGGGFKGTMVGMTPGPAPAAAPAAQGFKGTIVGMTPGAAPASPGVKGTIAGMPPGATPASPGVKGTIAGMTPGAAPASPGVKGTIAGMTPGAAPANPAFKGTMVGMIPGAAPAAPAFQPAPHQPRGANPALGGTMIGMTSSPAAPAPGAAPAPFAPAHQTLIGAVARPAGASPSQPAPPAPAGSMKQTMLGVAGGPSPGAGPHFAPTAQAQQPHPTAGPASMQQTFAGVSPSQHPPAAPPQAGSMKQTMLGVAGGPSPGAGPHFAPAAQPEHAHVGPGSMQQTFSGGVQPSQPPPAAPPQGGAMKQTMLGGGMAPASLPPQQPAAVPGAGGSVKQTMLAGGAAPPSAAPAMAGTMVYAPGAGAQQTQPVPYDAPMPAGAGLPHGAAPRLGMKQTVVGVSTAIAPEHPGQLAGHSSVPVAPPLPVPEPPAPPKIAGLPRGALVLIAVAAFLAVAALIVAVVWRSPHPLTAEVLVDERGAEQVSVHCEDCPDGTTISIGQDRGKFAAKGALIPLSAPLKVGKNDLHVALRRPGIGRDEDVQLSVSVAYRAYGDLARLGNDPPAVAVVVQAAPGAAAIVDGTPVQLDASGRGERLFELGKELQGPSDTIVPFDKRVPYTFTVAGGSHPGEVTLHFGIVPLRVDAPGEGIVVDQETFMLAGRTLKDGRVTVAGRPITVDPEGRFAQAMNVSSIGETTIVVRADAQGQAPRLVSVRVKRVASLSDEASEYRRTASSDFGALESGGTPQGQKVVLDGEVAEARADGEVTVLLLELKKGCAAAPCLAKVVYGGHFDAEKGASLSAFGVFGGLVEGARTGTKIPLVSAEFLVRGGKKH